MNPRHRLFFKLWLALVAAVFISLFGGALTMRLQVDGPPGAIEPAVSAYAQDLVDALPDEPQAIQQHLEETARQRNVVLGLFSEEGAWIAGSPDLPPLRVEKGRDHWVRGHGGAGVAVHLDDGRWMLVGHDHPSLWKVFRHVGPVFAVVFALLAGAAWPLARHLTRRIEALRRGVEDLGRGDLTARVPVHGHDEVAQLARSFNASAARIETLVEGQRRVLASASHELRTPLTRIRMAAELARMTEGEERTELLASIDIEIEELDALIDDVLLASRLDAGAARAPDQDVDLGVLAREEAARTGATVVGEGNSTGDERMLRRLIRNLLENAQRHGADPVTLTVDTHRITVHDAGPGIPPDQRVRIFEPFYRPQGHSEADGGVGLGLSLVQRIARHHQGQARVDQVKEGTQITVLLWTSAA